MKKRLLLAVLTCLLAGSASAPSLLQARQDNIPGMPTVARMFILNRTKAEAVPVVLHSSTDVIPVVLMTAPALSLVPSTVVGTRDTRQTWEYRQLRVAASEDPTSGLNGAGADGWEAVGSASAGVAGGTVWVLKRPRQ